MSKKENKEIATKQASVLPALSGASAELMERMADVKDNLESVENFKLPRAKMTASGLELVEGDAPILTLEGVIIHTKKTNVYYDKPYTPGESLPPTCYSVDGETPTGGEQVQNPTCKGCPKAEFGTNSMKTGKACRNLKPLYMLLSDESIMPRQLIVTPASLKLANQYLMDLTERGVPYRKVKTKVELYKENPRDTYFKMRFKMGTRLDEQAQKNVEYLRTQWMPVMNAQGVDVSELGSEQGAAAKPVVDNGDF